MRRIHVAISMGDPAGIGPEVLAKALKSLGRMKDAAFFVAGDSGLLHRYGLKNFSNISFLDQKNPALRHFKPGKPTPQTAKASLEYLDQAVGLVKEGMADCLVTAPLSKENVRGAGFLWPGHTEFLAHAFRVKQVEMVFVSKRFKVVLLTRHVALREAVNLICQKKIEDCGSLVFNILKKNFKIKNPKIAVCGVNPHAGEAGLFGKEEIRCIIPAVRKLNKRFGKHFYGPLAADTVFYKAYHGGFDLVMAMYHDQGLIPFKMVEFVGGVNLTAGLPFVRTSPVHGTAYDIAGKNIAHHGSMTQAILLAVQLAKNSLR